MPAKKKNRAKLSRLKNREPRQRRNLVEVDLSGDSPAQARYRVDVFIRTTLLFLPGNPTVKVYVKSASQDISQDKSLLNQIYVHIKDQYGPQIGRIAPPKFEGKEGWIELVLGKK